MLPSYVVLDLETTGGNASQDRITEIAAVRIDNGLETARWSTLVNPGVRIPPFIQSLTGITDAMVENAPTFAQVSKQLLELLEGAVFVAHNVRFDHGFVANELARLDVTLKVKTLCTVRLSRHLYPQHKGHGLDAILQRHGLQTQARHRAMGDVDVVLAWLDVANRELGAETLQAEALELLQGSAALPPQLETPVSDIPDTPGVYLLYGEGSIPLYVGKSATLRTRVTSHLQASSKSREMRLLQKVRRIEWRETAGELGALLLQSRLVKTLKPPHNRRPRRDKPGTDGTPDAAPPWPHPGRMGIREHNALTGRTDIHIFDQWCHVATVHDEEALQDAITARQPLAFDPETYRLLRQRLSGAGLRSRDVISLGTRYAPGC